MNNQVLNPTKTAKKQATPLPYKNCNEYRDLPSESCYPRRGLLNGSVDLNSHMQLGAMSCYEYFISILHYILWFTTTTLCWYSQENVICSNAETITLLFE